MSYHELIYTVIVTAASTAITIGATLCVGQVVQLAGSIANTATKELSKSASKTLLGLLQPTAGFTASSVALAVVREIGQEVFIDPWIESAVSGWVRRAGGDAMMQMVLSSVAESLRETLTGPFANLFSSQRSGGASFYERLDARYFSKDLTPTIQDLLNSFNDYKAEIDAQIELQKEQMTALGRGFKALTFILGAVGFGVAQFIGPPASLFYASLATVCFTEEISLKNVFSKAFNPIMVTARKVGESKVSDYYRNNKKETLTLIGIGAWSIGLMGLRVLLPSLSLVCDILSGLNVPITIGMTGKQTHIKKVSPTQASLDKLVKTYLEVFTEEEDLVYRISTRFQTVLPRSRSGKIIHRSGLLPKTTLCTILGIHRDAIYTVKQITGKRYVSLFKIGTGPAYYRARTNSMKSINNFDFATRAFYNYLEDYGLEIKYTYKIVELFSKYSTAPNPGVFISQIAEKIGISNAHFSSTLGFIDSTLQRLVNIYLLNPPDVAKFSIPAGNLKSLKEGCYHATLGALVENEKIGMFVGLDTFKLTFYTLLSINSRLGGGNVIRPHTQQYSINDLSAEVYAKTGTIYSHRSALAVNIRGGAVPLKRVLTRFSEIIYANRLETTEYGKIAAEELTSYIEKYRPSMLNEYNQFFLNDLVIPQTLEMLDLTLGLDVLSEEFFLNVAFPGIQRHHPDRDKFYFNIFDIDDMANYRIKLLPLASGVHFELHGNYKRRNNWQAYLFDNDLARARTKHLYEILQRSYNSKINYNSLLMNEFDKEVRTVERRDIKIWENFDSGVLKSWIKRLIDKKTMSYEMWHLKYYDEFYTKRYLPYMGDMSLYINGDPKCKHPDFWEWYISEYMPNNRYPIFY